MLRKLNTFGIFIFAMVLTLQQSFSNETITLLDRGELHPSMIADNGVFWIGHSRRQFNSEYRLEVYTPEGKLIDQAPMSHSLIMMKKAGSNLIMMTGINPNSQLTEYTTAKLENGKIRLRTTQINLGGFITFWIGALGNRHYFVDMGGNPDDTTTNLSLPAQTIFSSTGSNATYLNSRVRMPVAGTLLNNKLLLVSSQGIGMDAGSIVEVDPRSSAIRVLLTSKEARFKGLEVIPGTTHLVTSASALNKLIILDSASGQIRRELPTLGYTRAFVLTGHCLIAGNDETNTIEVFDLNSKEDKAIITENVKMAAAEFSGIKQIAVDNATGTVFARSNFSCNPMTTTCDKDYNRVITFGTTVAENVRKLCH